MLAKIVAQEKTYVLLALKLHDLLISLVALVKIYGSVFIKVYNVVGLFERSHAIFRTVQIISYKHDSLSEEFVGIHGLFVFVFYNVVFISLE